MLFLALSIALKIDVNVASSDKSTADDLCLDIYDNYSNRLYGG
jgi:hypothetical protein